MLTVRLLSVCSRNQDDISKEYLSKGIIYYFYQKNLSWL
jgi:hypothetical protein